MTNLASFGQDPTVKAFGMDVDRNMLRLKGRILDPPQLAYNGGLNRITPADGKWNLRNLKFM